MPTNRCELKREILTVAEVAAIYGRSIDTVHGWIDAGDLKAFDMGKGRGTQKPRIGIRPEALVEFEKRRAIVPEPLELEKPKRRPKLEREYIV